MNANTLEITLLSSSQMTEWGLDAVCLLALLASADGHFANKTLRNASLIGVGSFSGRLIGARWHSLHE